MDKVFLAVEPGRRIALRHEQAGHSFTLDMAFEAVAEGTWLTWTATFDSPQQLSAVREAFAQGNQENLDRLEVTLRQAANH